MYTYKPSTREGDRGGSPRLMINPVSKGGQSNYRNQESKKGLWLRGAGEGNSRIQRSLRG